MAASETYTIGKVVKRLSAAYPDLSVSKVRFLESEGLLEPQRTKSGYRLYSDKDIARLETILRLQKNYFYPLSVIKERLEALDEAEGEEESPSSDSIDEDLFHGPIALEDAPSLLGIPVAFIRSLADNGIIRLETVSFGHQTFRGEDVRIIAAASALRTFGIDPRFLKPYVQRANRDAGVFRQALVSRMGRQNNLEDEQNRRLFDETLDTLVHLTNTISEGIVRREVRSEFNYPDRDVS